MANATIISTDDEISQIVLSLRPLADWWAAKIQWAESDHEDLTQEGLLELVKTLRCYQRSGKEIKDLKSLASTCFSAAMKWWYKKSDRTLEFDSLYDQVHIPVDNMEVFFSGIYIDCYLEELERVHGYIAKLIVMNLLNPSEDVGTVVIASMKEKAAQKAAGSRVINHSTARAQKQHIRMAMGLDTNEWDRTMATIKSFTKEYTCREQESENGHSPKVSSTQPLNFEYPTRAYTTHSQHLV